MESIYKDVLQKLQNLIVDDVDINNGVVLPLKTEYILKDDDISKIQRAGTREEQTRILLELLPERGSKAFEVFHQSLKHHYPWISDKIDEELKFVSAEIVNEVDFIYPNIQPVSPLTVNRIEMTKKLKNALEKLEPSGYVAFHGMKGFGKSSLTASILKEKIFAKVNFENKIYWIKFSNKHNIDEEILDHLHHLHQQINSLSSIESVSSEPLEIYLRNIIDHHFRNSKNRNSLLILDDVYDKKIIDKFDFKCKTLVITTDLGVLEGRNPFIVEMDHGFTENETLGLFAKVLDVNVNKLPVEAKKIHEECKGMPLLIAMLAAQFTLFKHDMKNNVGRWAYYLDCLKTKNAKNKVIEEFFKIQESTFDVCIDQLDKKTQKRYENLAIFNEDVNIMPKTLEILWEEEPYFVEEEMLRFCSKSLAAQKWNEDLKSYIYGVHDLLLCHLRKKLKSAELKEMHKSFVNKYRKFCDGDFSKLPDDNYSFSYIGYHLEQAELIDEFPKLYLNFDFLEAKINHSGLSDLFIDLKKYRKYITNFDSKILSDKLENLEIFLQTNANIIAKHRLMKCLDLIQIALNYEDEGFVQDAAYQLAKERPLNLYICHQLNLNHKYVEFCEEIEMHISTVVFTDNQNHILAGSTNGKLILWDCKDRKIKFFHGHNQNYAIKKILVSFSGKYFLALSEDGLLKLFELKENDYLIDNNLPVQSPRLKQTFWKNCFLSDPDLDDSSFTFSVNNEVITDMTFSQNDENIAVCTNKGSVFVWTLQAKEEWKDHVKQQNFSNITFTTKNKKDRLLHLMNVVIGCVRIYKKNDKGFEYLSQFNLKIFNPSIIHFSRNLEDENCLVIVTNKKALFLKWFWNKTENVHSYEVRNIVEIENENDDTYYTAATLTYDAKYLIIGNSKGIIEVIHSQKSPRNWITSFKGLVNSLDSYNMNAAGHLICGSERKWIHGWKIGANETPKPFAKPLFVAEMLEQKCDNKIFLKTSAQTITVCKGQNVLTKIESNHGNIEKIILNDDSKQLIYITDKGSVVQFDEKYEQSNVLVDQIIFENFINILYIKNNHIVLSRDINNSLMVYYNEKIYNQIRDSGYVRSAYKFTENCVMTISKNCMIKLWYIDEYKWSLIDEFKYNNATVLKTSISFSKTYISVLTEEQTLIVFKITDLEAKLNNFYDEKHKSCINIHIICDLKYQLNCCEFSKDEKYLAVAVSNGDIYIYDLLEEMELSKLQLHSTSVNQLHWAPVNANIPILLSVNCNELAWWNISYLHTDKSMFRRSRMGSTRSTRNSIIALSPSSSVQISNSFKNSSTFQDKSEKGLSVIKDYSFFEYWKRKFPKNNMERPGLLSVVQLPSACTDNINICVSDDFSKFLTVDVHGMVSDYKLFEFTQS